MKLALNPPIADVVPWSECVTRYDEEHFIVYLRLLDAEADGATPGEMARVVLGIDPLLDPQRAILTLQSHLRRAQWMTRSGYLSLLQN